MPTLIAPEFSKSVTISGIVITVDSTTDIWPGQIGYILKSGQTTRRVKVVEVRSATTLTARYFPHIGDDNFAKNSASGVTDAGWPNSMAPSDLSAYTTGTLSFENQLVATQPDYTKPR